MGKFNVNGKQADVTQLLASLLSGEIVHLVIETDVSRSGENAQQRSDKPTYLIITCTQLTC